MDGENANHKKEDAVPAYDNLSEAIRKQRVLFFALCGLKDAGNLKEDERIGLFEMAGDIANQLETVRAEIEKNSMTEQMTGKSTSIVNNGIVNNGIETIGIDTNGNSPPFLLSYRDESVSIIRKGFTADGRLEHIDDLIEQVIYLFQGLTFEPSSVFKAFERIKNETGIE